MLRKIRNLIRYQVWTDCEHEWQFEKGYFAKCRKCGALTGDYNIVNRLH